MAPHAYKSNDWTSLQEAASMTAILAREDTGEKIKNWFTPDRIFFFSAFGFLLAVVVGYIIWCSCR
ncbi:hypothetical protein CEP52_015384, partial [Fusarium oligoseptatum]